MLLRSHRLDLAAARRELGGFEDFLRDNPFFGERAVVRLLKQSPDRTSLVGTLGRGMIVADSFKYELGIQGVVYADLVLRNASRSTAVFVEFEGGEEHSVFSRRSTNHLHDWGAAFDRATGQIVDWAWMMADAAQSAILAQSLGMAAFGIQFVAVCGRDGSIPGAAERQWFGFRRSRLSIAGCTVVFLTHDELARELRYVLQEIRAESTGGAMR